LENQFTKLATDAKRYIVKNGNDPNPGNITEEKESELEEFIEYSKIVMGILGHKIFVPLDEITEDTPREKVVRLHLKERGADATGFLTSEGIIVCEGSKIRATPTPSCREWIKRMRIQNRIYIDKNFILTKDFSFDTPSAAAAFCVFAEINGRTAWKDESGKTLKELDAEV